MPAKKQKYKPFPKPPKSLVTLLGPSFILIGLGLGSGELILWPWGDGNGDAPNATELTTLGRKFANFTDYTPHSSFPYASFTGVTQSNHPQFGGNPIMGVTGHVYR